jgi:hypothetical protein
MTGWSLKHRSALAVGVAVMVASCGGPAPSAAVTDLQDLMPTLATYHVTNFMRVDGCEYIAYARGAFVTDPSLLACEVDVDGPSPRKPIDAQARADLDAIYRAQRGPQLEEAFPEYSVNGTITGGQFGFDTCTSYVYHPGWEALPESNADYHYTAINSDWFEMECEY